MMIFLLLLLIINIRRKMRRGNYKIIQPVLNTFEREIIPKVK